MSKGKKRGSALIRLGVALLICGAALIAVLFYWNGVATTPDPNPHKDDVMVSQDGFDYPSVDWEYWQDVNPDVIGWVSIPDTDLSLPICQAPADDPDYYLTHDVKGSYNVYGCPYLDADCVDGFDSAVALISGHHMNDGSMFSILADYSDKDFRNSHLIILLQTPTKKMALAVANVRVIDSNAEVKELLFDSKKEYRNWVLENVGQDYPNATSVKVFCTCSYGPFNGHERTLVYAVEE